MIKKLVKMILLGLLIFLVSKGFIAFTVYQAMTKFKDQHSDTVLLTYQWISSSLDGTVSLKGVELTPYAMKKTFSIEEIQFIYSDYISMISRLSSLTKGELTGLKAVSLPTIQTELTGKSLKELLSADVSPAWFTPFNLYGCGTYKSLSAKEYQQMGIKQHNMSLYIELDKQEGQPFETLSINIDRQELGEFSLSAKLPTHSLQRSINDKAFDQLSLQFLSLEYKDAGFFRRLNILCNQNGPENRALYSLAAAVQWKDAMFSKGLFVNEAVIETYSNYLLQGGSISLEATTDEGIKVADLSRFVDKELFQHFDAKLVLNGYRINDPQLYPDSETLFPPPVIVSEPKIIETPKRQAGYRNVDIAFVAEHIDRKIRVVMQDGKVYEGQLTLTTEYNLQLTQSLPGGAVHYPLMFNQIDTFEVWFNQEK